MSHVHTQFKHDDFIAGIQAAVLNRLTGPESDKVASVKLVYGWGSERALRGRTHAEGWIDGDEKRPLVEICAAGQQSLVQVAGTVIHELGHVVAGTAAGHSKAWKEACAMLGLRHAKQGQNYVMSNFEPSIREAIARMPEPDDGTPAGNLGTYKRPSAIGCLCGIGTRGGTSRGAGSGSRLRKYVCGHGQIIRASTDNLTATCDHCHTAFKLA